MDHVVHAARARRTETPNAVMTTLASPTLGGSETMSLWTVAMEQAARGPLHAFDSEQVWSVLEGEIVFSVDGVDRGLVAGDSIVIPAGTMRQVTAKTAAKLIVCGSGLAIVSVEGEAESRGTPAWVG